MDILNYIPYGKENAINRDELTKQTGQSDRINRQLIHIERRKTPIICTDKGYYRPTEREISEVKKWIARESNRAKSTFWALRAAKKFVKGVS